MKLVSAAVILAAALTAGCATSGSGAAGGVKGLQFEGCECDTYCPCLFDRDATADQCRVLLAWRASEGSFNGTSLAGVSWAAAVTKTGKNIKSALGHFEGVLYLPKSATDAQRDAIGKLMTAEMGKAFAKMTSQVVPIEIKGENGHYELQVGQVGTLKISPLKNAKGEVTVIENAPSPLALAREHCAKADVNTYNDGGVKWDFSGRNGYYGEFHIGAAK